MVTWSSTGRAWFHWAGGFVRRRSTAGALLSRGSPSGVLLLVFGLVRCWCWRRAAAGACSARWASSRSRVLQVASDQAAKAAALRL